jgi:hypothetical protein
MVWYQREAIFVTFDSDPDNGDLVFVRVPDAGSSSPSLGCSSLIPQNQS